jgi:RNA polymerase sigma factor (sigma-70 family)
MTTLNARQAPRVSTMNDAALFEAMARGDLGSLGVLFDRHHEALRQFVLRAAPNSADVDDIVQETFLTATNAAGSFDGRTSGLPFLIGISVQLIRRRKRTFARIRALYDAFAVAPMAPKPTPEDRLHQAQEEASLQAAITRLSEERRLVLVMVEYNGMTGVEVAGILGIPVGTIWRRLHEARAELRQALERGKS